MTEQHISELEGQLLEAITRSDLKVLDELLHTDLLFNLPNGQTITKAMDMETHASGNLLVNSIIPSDRQISIIENTAVVAVTLELEGSYLGEPMSGSFRYLRVWKQEGESWKVIAGSCRAL